MLKSVLDNDFVLNLLNKIYVVLIGLGSSILLARYLGVESRGDYSYIIQIVSIVTIVLNIGMHQSYSYFYRQDKNNIFQKYASIFISQFLLNIVLALGLIVYTNNYILVYILLLIPFSVLAQQLESIMTVENIRKKIKVNYVINFLKFVFLSFLLIINEKTLMYPILILIGLYVVTFFFYLKSLKISNLVTMFNIGFLAKVISFGWVPMLTALLISLNYSVDIILLKHLSSSYNLGIYSIAAGLITYFWLVPDSFKEVLVSRVARNESLHSTLLSIKVSFLFLFIVITSFALVGDFAVTLMYGKEYSESYEVTLILSLGTFSMIFYKMFGVILLAEGKRYIYFFNLLVSVLLNIVLNFMLIPKFGMYGAAISTVFSYNVCGILFLSYFIKAKGILLKEVLFFSKSDIEQLRKSIRR
ncbi:polysaccharide biosynthesis C-terminal domain-containing protein [Exiguobacterium aurantiacum]|uniref:oligosaccharide flippase family protein n=1 Tax=Exiguobacterium aurantiacum TaxID=33987 RepID=UPI00384ABF1D